MKVHEALNTAMRVARKAVEVARDLDRGLEAKAGTTGKWAAYGAAAGGPLPIIGVPFGALLGAGAAKVWQWRQATPEFHLRDLVRLERDGLLDPAQFAKLQAVQLERLVEDTSPRASERLRTLTRLVTEGVIRNEVAEPFRLRLIEKL